MCLCDLTVLCVLFFSSPQIKLWITSQLINILLWAFLGIWKQGLKEYITSIAWLLLAFFSKYFKYAPYSWRARVAHLGHRRLLQATGYFQIFSRFPWPTELTLHLDSHLGMWEGLVSLLSPFNLDLSGAVSAGWIGGFNNVNACLLEWAQVNLTWRGPEKSTSKRLEFLMSRTS